MAAASAGASSVLGTTPKKTNFQRLSRLLIAGGTSVLREVFDSIYAPVTLPAVLASSSVKTQLSRARLTKPQWDSLYPAPGCYGKSSDFDITLLFKLLRTICSLPGPSSGWDSLPSSADQNVCDDLARVKFYRNDVYGHGSEAIELSEDMFSGLWAEISGTLTRLAHSVNAERKQEWQQAIAKLQTDPLTPEDERNFEELQRWYRSDFENKKMLEQVSERMDRKSEQVHEERERKLEQTNKEIEQPVGSPPTLEPTCSGAVPDVKTLNNLSKELSNCWTSLGIQLDVKASTIDCIRNDNVQYPSIQEKAFAMLRAWHDTGSAATFKQLAEGLRQIDKGGLAEKYCTPSNAGVNLNIDINGESAVQMDGTSLPAPSVGEIMRGVAADYRQAFPLKSPENFVNFVTYLERIRLLISDVSVKSLHITVMCTSLEILEHLWQNYTSGALNEAAQRWLVTDEVLKKHNLKQFKLVTTINEEAYSRCKAQFIEMQELQRCDRTESTTVPGKTAGFPSTEFTTVPGKTAGFLPTESATVPEKTAGFPPTESTTVPGKTAAFPPTESTTLPGKTAGFLPTESTTIPEKTAAFPPAKSTDVPGKTVGFPQTESLSDSLLGLKLETPEAEKDPDFKSQTIKKMMTLKSLALDAVLKIDEKTGYSVLHTICINKDEYNANRVAMQAILAGHDIKQHRVSEKAEEFAGLTPSKILKKAGFTDHLNHMFGDATREVYTYLQQGDVDQFITHSVSRSLVRSKINVRQLMGWPLMTLLAMSGSVKAVQSLVERRSEVKAVEKKNFCIIYGSEHQLENALCAASAWNNYSMAELLIREGADVNEYIRGNTALHYAAGNGNVEIVKLLLASGAHINQTDGIGNSALHLSLAPRVSSRLAFMVSGGSKKWRPRFELGICDNLIPIAVSAFTPAKRAQTANFLIEQADVEMQAKNQLGESPLYLALAAGDAEIVLLLSEKKEHGKEYPRTGDMQLRHLIELKLLDVNINNNEGKTPLHQSVEVGDVKTVAWLLQLGADINAVDNEGRTPLYATNSQFHLETVLMLTDLGVKVDVQDDGGHTPLHLAAMEGCEELVDVFLKRSVEIDAVDKQGRTALMVAIKFAPPKIALKLVVGGAKLDVRDNEGRTPLHLAAMEGCEELVDVFLKRSVKLDTVDKTRRTALHVALDYSHPKIALKLAVGGAKLDLEDNKGRTSLHLAAMKGYEELVDIFLKRSVEIDAVDKQGRTALMMAIKFAHPKIALKLVVGGAKLDVQDSGGSTLLYLAAMKGYEELVDILLKRNVEIDAVDKEGHTALQVALDYSHPKIALKLAVGGAKLYLEDNEGRTSLHLAAMKGYEELVDVLLERSVKLDAVDKQGRTALHVALDFSHFKTAVKLIEGGAKLDFKDRKVRLLHKAIGEGDVTVIMALVKVGADINEKGEHGKTLLHVSVEKRNLDVIKVLINSGADVNRQTDSGCTALRLALKANAPEERVAMTRILLEAGADANIRDIAGKSPLDTAVLYRYVECADLLRQSVKYQR